MDAYKILLSLIGFSSLFLGFDILRKDPKKAPHWFFFVKSIILAVFAALAVVIQYAKTPSEAQFWYKYYTLAMLIQPLSFFIFYSLIIPQTKMKRLLRGLLILYFAFIALVWASVPPKDFCEYIRLGEFWIVSEASSLLRVNLQVIYISLVPLILFLYILHWGLHSKTNKEKHHARLVLISLVLVYILSFLADCLHIRVVAVPHITPLIFFVYLACVYYAHIHYYFLENDLGKYLEDMLDNSNDLFIFLDTSLNLEKLNAVSLKELGLDPKTSLGRPLEELLQDPEDLKLLKTLAENPLDHRKDANLRLKSPAGPLCYEASINRVEDRFKDFIGIYIFARTKTELKQFQKRYGISPKQMEIFYLILKGLSNAEISEKLFISRRTVETHIAALYGHLQVSNKIELLNRASEVGFL